MNVNAIDRIDLEHALSRIGDGVCGIGGDGRIVMWNASAERILGLSRREAIGRPCCEVFAGRDGDGNRLCYQGCHVQSLVKLGEPVQSFDMALRTKAGNPIWLNISILTFSANGHGPLTVHLFREVTAAREMLALVNDRGAAALAHDDPEPLDTPLTRREIEVLRLLVRGLNTKRAADELHLSRATIRNHVQNIFAKLGVHSRLEAVAHAAHHHMA